MNLTTSGKMEFNFVVNSNNTQQSNTSSANTIQHNVVMSSGGDLSLLSNGSILFQATDIDANKSINAAAKGGFLFAQAMQESKYYQSATKKRKWYGAKKTVKEVKNETTNYDI